MTKSQMIAVVAKKAHMSKRAAEEIIEVMLAEMK